MANVLRNLPSVNELLENPSLKKLVDKVSHNVVVSGAREFLDNLRSDLQSAASEIRPPTAAELADRIAQWILDDRAPGLRTVVNATGIVLHSDLGGAPLAEEALEAIVETSRGYCSLEIELQTGDRWKRTAAIERALRRLTGAEAAVVVHSSAAAMVLVLTALAQQQEVIISRGQFAELNDDFRLADAAAASGAVLREVGAANKSSIGDYQQAIGPQTAALLSVRPRNYAFVGESQQPALDELIALGRRRQIPVVLDLGAAALVDMSECGLADEPVARDSLKAGADLVLCDGGGLIGGPPCGIIIGRRALCQRIAQHPLAGALQIEKTSLAALSATLRLYEDPQVAHRSVPVLSLLATPLENLKNRAGRLAPQIAAAELVASAEPVECAANLTAAALPSQNLPSWAIAVTAAKGRADELAASLRSGKIAVLGRVDDERLMLDLRTVLPSQDRLLVDAFESLAGQPHATDVAPQPATAPSDESAAE